MTIQIGIELEMTNITGNEVVAAITEAGAECYPAICGYHAGPSADSGQWKMESDSSLNGRTATMTEKGCIEVISPILYGADGVKTLNRILTRINRAGAQVDRSCGTHISVGVNHKARWNAMTDERKRERGNQLIRVYQHFLPIFDGMSPNCRNAARNPYVGVPRESYMGRTAINIGQYIQYGRIEFRQPGFTLSKDKIGLWLAIINKMVSMMLNENHRSAGLVLEDQPVTVDSFATYLGLPLARREQLRARILELYNNHREGRVERLAVLSSEVECICCGAPFTAEVVGQNICNDEGCF